MAMRTCRISCAACRRDCLTFFQMLSLINIQTVVVCVQGHYASAMVYHDSVAIALHPAGKDYSTGVRRQNRVSVVGSYVKPGMKLLCTEYRVDAQQS